MTATTEHAVVHAIRSIQLLGETWPSWALRPMCTKILVLDIKGRRKNANKRPILARPPPQSATCAIGKWSSGADCLVLHHLHISLIANIL